MTEEWKALILDHYKNPRAYGELEDFTTTSEQHNRTCGDHVKVYAQQGVLGRFGFIGAGCSLCLASASLMMELVQDKTKAEVSVIAEEFRQMWEGGLAEGETRDAWKALAGLRAYPVRSRCVKLAWQALDEILLSWV
ncbi:MAG: SUF system NifU family Fe-S cluster assembly protein [Proteobacteria bacterium]|nr:MAG: SUF system NifU family Fe-S cluster assembly protein [Pseudomonadota bacterium]